MPSKDFCKDLPTLIRVSTGTAILLGLAKGKLDAEPTTAYFMTYRDGKCTANCSFCPQARQSDSRADMLSRVSWPAYEVECAFEGLIEAVDCGKIKRVCIQALNYSSVFDQVVSLVKAISEKVMVPISVSCQPLIKQNTRLLAEAGVERIGIPLDAATEELFVKIKGKWAGGPYDWRQQYGLLREAVSVFGENRVSTHFIVGLGETEKEMTWAIQKCVEMKVLPGLFAFTPVRGTALESCAQPPIEKYRRIQLARHLIVNKMVNAEDMRFDEEDKIASFGMSEEALMQIVKSGKPFLTSGCPDCNRPYYNEKPSGPIYNYPKRLTEHEISEVLTQLCLNRSIRS
jgi:biotin synthase